MIQNPFSKKSLLAAAFGAALVLPSVPVFALAINPLAPANGFDVFVKNDLTLVRTEGEGALAAGHNLNLALQGNYQIGSNIKSPYKIGGSTVSLVVGNQVNLSSGNIAYVENGNQVRIGNLGNVKVWEKDLNNASMNTRITKPSASPDGTPRLELRTKQSAASIASDSGIDFTTAFTSLEANAQALSKIAPHRSAARHLPRRRENHFQPHRGPGECLRPHRHAAGVDHGDQILPDPEPHDPRALQYHFRRKRYRMEPEVCGHR